MITTKNFFLVACILCFIVSLQAQNYKKGFIITNENETINGFIDFRTDDINSKQCRFKKDMNSEAQIFYPDDIQSYRFNDGKYYVSREITINDKTSKVFLEFLVEGIINLYYYSAGKQKYFYFEDEKGEMIAYTQRPERINDEGYYVQDSRYKGMIHYYFQDSETIQKKAANMKFDQKSFIDIAQEYHNEVCTTGEDCIVYVNKKPDESGVKIKFSVFTGLQHSKYVFDLSKAPSFTAKNISPMIGMQASIMNPRWSKSFALQFELALSQFKEKTKEIPVGINNNYSYSRRFDYKAISLSPKLGVRYTYPKFKIRPTVGAGVVYTMFYDTSCKHELIYNSGNVSTSSEYKMKKQHWGYYANIGAEYPLKEESAIFLRLAIENYSKGDATQLRGKDKIKTPNLIFGYTF